MNKFWLLLSSIGKHSGGTGVDVEALTVTENGIYTAPEGTAYNPVGVDVPVPVKSELSVTENGVYEAQEGEAYSSVTVDVPQTTVNPLTVDANGTYTAPTGAAYSPITVNVPTGGGEGSEPRKDVNFFDYDGTIVASYTSAEAAALTALPANPSHNGLTAQGWNYTLEEMKAEVTAQGKCDIGQMYITDDGKTRVYVKIPEGRTHPCLGLGVNGTVVVDWGDGSETSTLTGTSLDSVQNTDHVYAAPGDYTISLEATNGSYSIPGTGTGTALFKNAAGEPSTTSNAYTNAIRKVEIGASVSIGASAFNSCYSLAAVTIPSGVTSIGDDAFSVCYSLAAVTIPSGVTSIGFGVFSNCRSLYAVTIPSGFTSIGDSAFQSCGSLAAVTIPSGVTNIGYYAFSNCHSLSAVTIPSGVAIGGSAFSDCYSLAAVTIPSGVTRLGDYAFSRCYSLAAVTIPSGVTSIEEGTFYSCNALSAVTIPSGVTRLGRSVFSSCYGLSVLHFLPITPPSVSNSNAFSNVPTDCKIYVPTGTLEAYTTATNYPDPSTYTYVEE